jgi:FkbH-like protein
MFSAREDLHWLPARPAEFADRLKSVLDDGASAGSELRNLAQYALDLNGLNKLARALRRARAEGFALQPLAAMKLGVISNSTFSLVAPAIEATGLRYGLNIEVVEAPFGQVTQEALDPESALARAGIDFALIALDVHGVPLPATPGDTAEAERTVATAAAMLGVIRGGLKRNTNATLLWQTIPRLPETLFGSFDFRLAGTHRWLIEHFNRRLSDTLGAEELLVDIAGLAETIGLDTWHDPVQRHIGKLPFAQNLGPIYAEHVVRVLAAMRGKSRKALVLDLDNTLWGGIIGDDGVDGIRLGQGDAVGEAHLTVQQAALDLHARGIVLAVSSKNEDAAARSPFREHADMLLKEEHVAVFQANWIDKASNLATIADALTIGRDALAFLDDNPAERMQVRGIHPEIGVPEVTADAAYFARTLNAAGYFEAITYSQDDRQRTKFYKDNAQRLQLQGSAGSLDDYHRSLAMILTVQSFDSGGRSRIAQLANKSNQFNLTTRRYSEAEIAALEANPEYHTLQVRLSDVFGDNGMISVIVVRKEDALWEIETWLMSCRVLGRRVEEAVLAEIAAAGLANGVKTLVGRFIPTDRNMMVAEHYAKLGFTKTMTRENGETEWALDLAAFSAQDFPMKIIRQ